MMRTSWVRGGGGRGGGGGGGGRLVFFWKGPFQAVYLNQDVIIYRGHNLSE